MRPHRAKLGGDVADWVVTDAVERGDDEVHLYTGARTTERKEAAERRLENRRSTHSESQNGNSDGDLRAFLRIHELLSDR
jgi:hypothetical protein